MSVTATKPSLAERRRQEVAAAIEDVRAIETREGVNRAALEKVKARLIALATSESLFPPDDFPLRPDGGNRIYLLQEDPDGRFALYMSVGKTGKETPPHNHTTWAVIAGVKGKEHNRLYQRTDDGSVPGKGNVKAVREVTVEHGSGIALMPEDIHSIHLEGEPPTLQLHLYGLGLDRLHERIAFDTAEGTCQHFPASTIEKA